MQDNAVEHVDIGSAAGVSVCMYQHCLTSMLLTDVILAAQNAGPVPSETLTKKEKQASKREAFLHSQSPLLGTSLLSTDFNNLLVAPELKGLGMPSSKSHARREKRKAKEQLHGGGLDDIKTILTTIAASTQSDEKTNKEETSEPTETDRHEDGNYPRMQRRSGRIGKSKTEPLSQNQRKRVLFVSSHLCSIF